MHLININGRVRYQYRDNKYSIIFVFLICRGVFMWGYVDSILKSKFLKNVMIVATGVAGAQAITVLFSPVITRLYGPEAFGVLGTFSSLTNVIMPIAALTYPIAIVLPKGDREAKKLIRLSLLTSLIISSLTMIIILFSKNKILQLLNVEVLNYYIYLIPLVIFFAALKQVGEQWLIRTNQFMINAKSKLLRSIVINSSKVSVGIFYPFATVLIVLQAISEGFQAFSILFMSRKSSYKMNSLSNGKSYKALAKEHIDFPVYRAPEQLISSLSQNLPILLLTSFFGPASAGFYNIGKTVLNMPVTLLGKAIGDVFYPRISEAANNGENVTKLIKKATLALTGAGLIPFGIIIVFGPGLFAFAFGNEWATAGEYARWISLFSYSTLINRPSVRSLPVLDAQGFHLLFTIFRMLVRTLALILGLILFDSDLVAVALFGIVSFVTNILLLVIVLRISNKKFQR